MKQSTVLQEMTADARAKFVKQEAAVADQVHDQGRKEVGKALAVMELAGDTGSLDLKTYMAARDIDLGSMPNIYEFARVARAVLKEEIEMTEEEFDKANKSKIEILSRFFKEENQHKLGEAVEKVKQDATAKEIRGLLPKKQKNGGNSEDDGEPGANPNVRVALVVDDIAPDGAVLTSQALKNRVRRDIETALDAEPGKIEEQLDVLGRMLHAGATAAGLNPAEFLERAAADMARMVSGQPVEAETEKLAA